MRISLCSYTRKTILLFLGVMTLSLFLGTREAHAQAFMSSPYFGEETVTQGYRTGHQAYDYGLVYEPVLAAASGEVVRVSWFNDNCHGPINDATCGWGLYVRVRHSNNYQTIYAHLSSAHFPRDDVWGGPQVNAGQTIGMSGNTGWSTGAHLHFETRHPNGQNIDPNISSLWVDGQWGNPSRPIPTPSDGTETFVNATTNSTGGFTKGSGGPFNNSCTNNCGNWTYNNNSSMYWTFVNGALEDSWSRWQPSLPLGVYDVQVFVPNDNTNITSWQAPYTIIHSGGTSHTIIDQMGSRGRWISLGAYLMNSSSNVYITDASGETVGVHCGGNQWCRLGAGAVRFVQRSSTYLSDVRYNNSGWTSTLSIRNNGSGPATVAIRYLKANATTACTMSLIIQAHATSNPSCNNSDITHAVVSSSQDVSVAVLHEHNSPYTIDGYAGVEKPSNTVYIPTLHRNNSNWNSDIFIQNTSNQEIDVDIEFIPEEGPNKGNHFPDTYENIAPWGFKKVSTSTISELGSKFVGSAILTSDQPLAVSSTQYQGSNQMMATSNSQTLNTLLHGPLLQNDNGGYLSGLTLFNASNQNSLATVRYYTEGSGTNCETKPKTINANKNWVIYPAPPFGSGCSTNTVSGEFDSSQDLAVNVNQLLGTSQATTYAAIAEPNTTVTFLEWCEIPPGMMALSSGTQRARQRT